MPTIDTRPFLNNDNVLIVHKSIDGKGCQWIITDADNDGIKIEFGRITLIWLNSINPIKPDEKKNFENAISNAIIGDEDFKQLSNIVMNGRKDRTWKIHYDNMVEFILNKNIKTQDELLDFYKKYRYLAHYYFSGQPFMEYDEIPSKEIKPSEIVDYTIIKEQPYQIIKVYGYTNLFVLDLWEFLFNERTRYKIKQCKKCHCFFRTSAKNRDFCIDCQKLNEIYAEEYRNSPVNKLRKSIIAKLNSNNRFQNEEGDKKREKFMSDYDYYMDIVKFGTSNCNKPTDYDPTIKNEEDFVKCLTHYEDDVREYKRRAPKNGKAAKKS